MAINPNAGSTSLPIAADTIFQETKDNLLSQPKIISGFRLLLVTIKVRFIIFKIIGKHIKNPIKMIQLSRKLDKERRSFIGDSKIKKIAKVDGKHYWDLFLPAFESPAFTLYLEAEINRIHPLKLKKTNRLVNVLMAITKKCPLQCEHCFEWDALNGKDTVGNPEIALLMKNINETGIAILQLTGGEPLLKPDRIIDILQKKRKETDVWVLTSGFRLTSELAERLKENGLTGVFISLDHYLPEKHNEFRGFKDAYHWVETAVKNAKANQLTIALSVCIIKEMATEAHLHRYMKLAQKMGVSFVQFLEPKAVGHYAGQDVKLSKEHIEIIEKVFWQYNFSNQYLDFPVISYHGYYQRRMGCFAAGDRTIYIDTDGDIHACPFCHTKSGSAIYDDWNESLNRLLVKGCHSFKNANNTN